MLAPYVKDLAIAANSGGWSLVQPTLTSALQGWGIGSLDQDASDILQLTKFLKAEYASQAVILIGHSTGCQDAVRYAQRVQGDLKGSDAAPLAGIVLQAAVSDREYQAGKSTTSERLAVAEQMVQDGQGEDILFRDDDPVGTPVCARRFVSLASKHGDDDMFSSDFTDQELQKLLGHLAEVPTLLVLGGEDECMPKSVDGLAFGKRMQKAIGSKAQLKFIAKGTHSLQGTEQEFVDSVQPFVQQCFGSGNAGIKPPYLYSCT
ncbi:hypothetical protein ABBQ32_013610 [Trebouxia sp. C0010 RCD-2024]